MPRPLRYVPQEAKTWTDSYGRKVAVVEVTIRAYQSRYLFRPSPEVRDVIVGVMAHVQKRVKFDVYGYAFLSNHGSYLIGVSNVNYFGRSATVILAGLELSLVFFIPWYWTSQMWTPFSGSCQSRS